MIAMVLSVMTVMPLSASADVDRPNRCGDVDGNAVVNIMDALEQLKFLARLDSNILVTFQGTSFTVINEAGFKAARLLEERTPTNNVPTIMDVLEILKRLANIPTNVFEQNGLFEGCYCAWCGPTVNPPGTPIGSLPGGVLNTVYPGGSITASGENVTYTVTGGSLPPGLTLNPQTGAVTGTPIQTGTFTFTVTATNPGGSSNGTFVISVIDIPPTETDASTSEGQIGIPPSAENMNANLPGGTVGVVYPGGSITTTGTPNIVWTLIQGDGLGLPPGLVLNTNGTISGTPTQDGTFQFRVTATNNYGSANSNILTITIAPAPIETTTTSSATVSEPTVSQPTTVSGQTDTTPPTTVSQPTVTTEDDDDDERPLFRAEPRADAANRPAGFYRDEFRVYLVHEQNWEIWITFSSATGNRNGNTVQADDNVNNVNSGVAFNHERLRRHDGGMHPVRVNARTGEIDGINTPFAVRYDGNPLFANGVRVAAGRDAFTLSAVARCPQTGRLSDVRTRTWINDANLRDTGSRGGDTPRFHEEMLVFSIHSSAHGIYDYQAGIWDLGADRTQWVQEYVRLNPGTTVAQVILEMDHWLTQGAYPPTLPSNFTRRGRIAAERFAHLEIFDPTITEPAPAPNPGNIRQTRVVSQRVGIRVKGGWSRGTFVNEQKTFEIYCRENLGDRSNILYPLFGEQHDKNGNLLHRFERFRVRSGATDREQTYVRDELAQDLARLSGHQAIPQMHRPGVVFLNGAYYGLVWIKSPRTEDMWQRKFGGSQWAGARERGFEMIGSNERGLATCGRDFCGRAIPGAPAHGEMPIVPTHPTPRPAPALCREGGTGSKCGRPDCSNFHSSYNSGCASGAGTGGNSGCKGVRDWNRVLIAMTGGSAAEHRANPTPNMAALEQLVDMENLFVFYAHNIWGANVDWPANNVEMWRYYFTCGEGGGNANRFCLNADGTDNTACTRADCERTAFRNGELHPELDGKWRFLAHDYEYGLGLFQSGEPVAAATHETNNTIHALIQRTGADRHVPGNRANVPDEEGVVHPNQTRYHFNAIMGSSFIMPALMREEVNRRRLANTLSDLVENSHSWERSQAVLGYLYWTIEEEHARMMGGRRRGLDHVPANTLRPGLTIPDWEQQRPNPGSATNVDTWKWNTARNRTNGDMIRIAELPRSGTGGVYPNLPFHGSIHPGLPERGGMLHLRSFLQHRAANIAIHVGRPYVHHTAAGATQGEAPADVANRGTGLGLDWAGRTNVINATIANAGVNQGGSARLNAIQFGLHPRDAMQGTYVEVSAGNWQSNDPRLRSTVTGRYFPNAPIVLEVQPWPGFEALASNVTGATPIAGRPNFFTVTGTSVNITFTRVQRAEFAITAYRTNNTSSYIQITNIGGVAGAPTGLWLTQADGSSTVPGQINLAQFAVPATNLAPGASITIVNNSHTVINQSDDWDRRTPFNLSAGERLRLTTGSQESGGRILQTVEIWNTPSRENLTEANIWQAPAYRRGQDGKWRLDS
jgi:hypothetical protein